MSIERRADLIIADESGDVVTFGTSTEFVDEEGDFTNDDEAILMTVKRGDLAHVNVTRADLVSLREFIDELFLADAENLRG